MFCLRLNHLSSFGKDGSVAPASEGYSAAVCASHSESQNDLQQGM